jgi:hypothetical protein
LKAEAPAWYLESALAVITLRRYALLDALQPQPFVLSRPHVNVDQVLPLGRTNATGS